MNIVSASQGSAEWKAARCGIVTASRIADVMAEGKGGRPSTTRVAYMGELIAERLTGVASDSYTSAEMQRGTDLEPVARLAYEVATGRTAQEVGLVLHPTITAGASPDGLVGDDGLVEIKCPKTHTHIEYLLGAKPPAAYLPQMAWQCECTGREWVDFVSFDPRMPAEMSLFVVRYTPSREYLIELRVGVEKFLAEMNAKIDKLKSTVT